MSQTGQLQLVIACREELTKALPGGVGSPLFNIFRPDFLQPMTDGEIRQFIEERLAGTRVVFPPEEIDRIISESEGVPGRVQRLAYDLFEELTGE